LDYGSDPIHHNAIHRNLNRLPLAPTKNETKMKQFHNDTTAAIATAISTSSAVITFTQTWQPVLTFSVGIIGVVSGILAVVYYHKKIKRIDGKG